MFKILFALAFYFGVLWFVYFGFKYVTGSNPKEDMWIVKKGAKGGIISVALSLVFLLLHFVI